MEEGSGVQAHATVKALGTRLQKPTTRLQEYKSACRFCKGAPCTKLCKICNNAHAKDNCKNSACQSCCQKKGMCDPHLKQQQRGKEQDADDDYEDDDDDLRTLLQSKALACAVVAQPSEDAKSAKKVEIPAVVVQ